jgi:hypothetical protein
VAQISLKKKIELYYSCCTRYSRTTAVRSSTAVVGAAAASRPLAPTTYFHPHSLTPPNPDDGDGGDDDRYPTPVPDPQPPGCAP